MLGSRLQHTQHQFVATKRSKKGVLLQCLHMACPAGNDSRLGSAHQLVTTEAYDIRAILQNFPRHRFMMPFGPVPCWKQHTAAKVLHERHTFFSGKHCQFTTFGCSHKTFHEKIAAVHLQNQAGLRTDGTGIVIQCGVVGGANLAQFCPARFENVRKAKTAADLHQFAPRNNDLFFVRGEMAQVEHQRGSTVVDNHCSLSPT